MYKNLLLICVAAVSTSLFAQEETKETVVTEITITETITQTSETQENEGNPSAQEEKKG